MKDYRATMHVMNRDVILAKKKKAYARRKHNQ